MGAGPWRVAVLVIALVLPALAMDGCHDVRVCTGAADGAATTSAVSLVGYGSLDSSRSVLGGRATYAVCNATSLDVTGGSDDFVFSASVDGVFFSGEVCVGNETVCNATFATPWPGPSGSRGDNCRLVRLATGSTNASVAAQTTGVVSLAGFGNISSCCFYAPTDECVLEVCDTGLLQFAMDGPDPWAASVFVDDVLVQRDVCLSSSPQPGLDCAATKQLLMPDACTNFITIPAWYLSSSESSGGTSPSNVVSDDELVWIPVAGTEWFLGFDFMVQRTMLCVQVLSGSATDFPSEMFLLGSLDGATFTHVQRLQGVGTTAAQVFTITNPQRAYRHWRLQIASSGSDAPPAIRQIRFASDVSCPEGQMEIPQADGANERVECMTFTAEALTWREARDFCASQGFTLVVHPSALGVQQLGLWLESPYWIGLSDVVGNGEELLWLSAESGVVALDPSTEGVSWEQQPTGGGCVFVRDGLFSMGNCKERLPSVCSAEPVSTECESGWTTIAIENNAHCVKRFPSEATWFDARDHCMGLGATLAHLDEPQMLKAVATTVMGNDTSWLGLVTVDGANFVWVSSAMPSAADANWGTGEPSSAPTNWCGTLSANDNALYTAPCPSAFSFVCHKIPPSNTSSCEEGWFEFATDASPPRCFHRPANSTALTFAAAKATCWNAHGAHLAASTDAATHAFVAALFSPQSDFAWIGLSNSLDGATPWWMGTDQGATFTAWLGEPSAGTAWCAGMRGDGAVMGGWSATACNATTQSFVCERLASSECPEGWMQHTDSAGTVRCFQYHHTPLSWFEARDTAVANSGNLATIDSLELNMLLSSAAPDLSGTFHVGLTDLYQAGDYRWLGALSQDLGFVAWGGERVERCVQLRSELALWETVGCEETRWSVWERLPTPPCGPGEIPDYSLCYATTTASTFGSYVQQCLDMGELPCVFEDTKATIAAQFWSNSSFWIPMTSATQYLVNEYSRLGCATVTDWDVGQPSVVENKCAVAQTPKWHDSSCAETARGFCIVGRVYRTSCPLGFYEFENRCYKKLPTPYPQARAQEQCRTEGAQLVCLNNNNEAAAVAQVFAAVDPETVWSALLREADGSYRWPGWCGSDYLVWTPGSPGFDGSCGRIGVDGTLNDTSCDVPLSGVCEMGSWLQVTEMEGDTNLALGKAVLSSTSGHPWYAVDGNTGTSLIASPVACDSGSGLTVTVDLGTEALVARVEAVHEVGGSFCGIRTMLSSTGEFAGEEVEVNNTGNAFNEIETSDGHVVVVGKQRARFVRHVVAQKAGNASAVLSELRVIGRLFREENLTLDFSHLDHVQVPHALSGLKNFSIAFKLYIRDDSQQSGGIVHQYDSDCGSSQLLVALHQRRLRVETNNNSTGPRWGVVSAPLAPFVWHTVVVVQDTEFGGGMLYVDGELVGNSTAGAVELSCRGLFLGVTKTTGDGLGGLLDDFALWDSVALSASEAETVFASDQLPHSDSVVVHFEFDVPSLYYAKDSSGRRNHGFIEGTPVFHSHPVLLSGNTRVSQDSDILANNNPLLFQTNVAGATVGDWRAGNDTAGLALSFPSTSTDTPAFAAPFSADLLAVLASAATATSEPTAINLTLPRAVGVFKLRLVSFESQFDRAMDVWVEGSQVVSSAPTYTGNETEAAMVVVVVDTVELALASSSLLVSVRSTDGAPVRLSALTVEDLGCPVGFAYDPASSLQCVRCANRTTSSGGFASSCECDSGTFGPSCELCLPGEYMRDTGSEYCTGCPYQMTSPEGAVHWSQCACAIDPRFVYTNYDEYLCPQCATSDNPTGVTISHVNDTTGSLLRARSTAFASGSLDTGCSSTLPGTGKKNQYGWNCYPHLNDDRFGEEYSWIPSAEGLNGLLFGGLAFPFPTLVEHIAFGRDQTGFYTDRVTPVTVQYTTEQYPTHATTDWVTIGSVDRAHAGRYVFQFSEPLCASGIRLLVENTTCIDELEAYHKASATPTPSPTPSITPSFSPTPSFTPSFSPTPSVTPSSTPTPSVTPSPTPSLSPSLSPSSTVTPTSSPSRILVGSRSPSPSPSPLGNVFAEIRITGRNLRGNSQITSEAVANAVNLLVRSTNPDVEFTAVLVIATEEYDLDSNTTSSEVVGKQVASPCSANETGIRVSFVVDSSVAYSEALASLLLEDAVDQFLGTVGQQLNCTNVACCPELTTAAYSVQPVLIGEAVNPPSDAALPTSIRQSIDTHRDRGVVTLRVTFTRSSVEGVPGDDLTHGYRLVLSNNNDPRRRSANRPDPRDLVLAELRLDELGGAPGSEVATGFQLSSVNVTGFSYLRLQAFNLIGPANFSAVAAVGDASPPTAVASDVAQSDDLNSSPSVITATVTFRRPTDEVAGLHGTAGYRLYVGRSRDTATLITSKTVSALGGFPGNRVTNGLTLATQIHDDDVLMVVAYNEAFEADEGHEATAEYDDAYLDEALAAAVTAVGAVAAGAAVAGAAASAGASAGAAGAGGAGGSGGASGSGSGSGSGGDADGGGGASINPLLFVLQRLAAQSKRTIRTLDSTSRGVGASLKFTNFNFGLLGDSPASSSSSSSSSSKLSLKEDLIEYSQEVFVVSDDRTPEQYARETFLGMAIVLGLVVVVVLLQLRYVRNAPKKTEKMNLRTWEFEGLYTMAAAFAYFGGVTASVLVLTVDGISVADTVAAYLFIALIGAPSR